MALDPIEITGSLAIGTGLGGAIKDTVDPRLQQFKNEQKAKYPHVPLDAATAAEVAAEDVAKLADMQAEALLTGYEGARFLELYGVTLQAPGTGELLQMLRRDDEVSIDFAHGLRKARLETQWDAALQNLRWQRISATDLAYMVVRGIVPDDGTLPGKLPTTADNLNLPPQHTLNTLAEAARTGWDADRFAMLVQRSGLAMAPVMAAQAYFRGILTRNDYDLTIARGDLYPAFAGPVLDASRQIPTAHDFVEAYLRGVRDLKGMHDGAALHGMTNAHADLLYDITGRPTSIRQVYIGLARGAHFPAQYTDIPEPFQDAIRRSAIREPYASIAYENRYSLPSAFVVRALLSDGAIDAARGTTILEHSGWPPDLAALVAQHYAGGTAAVADPHVTKAQTRLWTTMQTSYINGETVAADLGPAFQALGIPAASQTQITGLWDHARDLERKQLTPTQLKKAVAEGVTNPATGTAWTHDEALARLISMGYSANDANTFLSI